MNVLLGTLGGLLACTALAVAAPRIATLPEGAIVPDAEVDGQGVAHVASHAISRRHNRLTAEAAAKLALTPTGS